MSLHKISVKDGVLVYHKQRKLTKQHFAKIYQMDSKLKAGDALKLFCQEFGVPEKLTFEGSKEQGEKGQHL